MGKIARKLILGAVLAVFATNVIALTFTSQLSSSHTTDSFPLTLATDSAVTVAVSTTGQLNNNTSGFNITRPDKSSNAVLTGGATPGYNYGPYPLKAGTYYMNTRNDGNASGTFTANLTITPQPLANDPEPNDTPYNTVAVAPINTTVTGHLGYYDQNTGASVDSSDYWAVTIPTDGMLNVTFQSDATFTQIGYNMNWSGVNPGDLLKAGTYYIQVTSCCGYGGYTLRAGFNPALANQTIGTITFSPPTLAVGGSATVSATATSGLPVTFSRQIPVDCSPITGCTPIACSVSGNTVTGISAGVCTVVAYQAGNASYNAAPQVTQAITVTGVSQSDCLFNWAEKIYSQYFSPRGATSATYAPYYYRYYSGTGNYLATSSADNQIYVLGPSFGNSPVSVGPVSSFLGVSACQ